MNIECMQQCRVCLHVVSVVECLHPIFVRMAGVIVSDV